MGSRRRGLATLLRERRGATMVEFAIIAPVFLLMLFFVFEVAYDQYLGVVLQATVQNLAHQVQTGSAVGDTEGDFLTKQYCPNPGNSGTLLGCNSLFVRIQRFDATSCTDLYNATQGTLPVDGTGNAKALELGLYFNANGGNGTTALGPTGSTGCTVNSGAFCDAGPNETMILTGIYISPSLLMGLIPGAAYSYNNSTVVAQIASVGFQTEDFVNTNSTCGT